MFNTKQDRREKQLRRFLKEHDKTIGLPYDQKKKVQAELGKQYKADIEDLHSAIRMTCSKPGPSDNSRAAYRQYQNRGNVMCCAESQAELSLPHSQCELSIKP